MAKKQGNGVFFGKPETKTQNIFTEKKLTTTLKLSKKFASKFTQKNFWWKNF